MHHHSFFIISSRLMSFLHFYLGLLRFLLFCRIFDSLTFWTRGPLSWPLYSRHINYVVNLTILLQSYQVLRSSCQVLLVMSQFLLFAKYQISPFVSLLNISYLSNFVGIVTHVLFSLFYLSHDQCVHRHADVKKQILCSLHTLVAALSNIYLSYDRSFVTTWDVHVWKLFISIIFDNNLMIIILSLKRHIWLFACR